MKKKIIGTALLLGILLLLWESIKIRKGEVFETYEVDCGSASLRVVAFHEDAYLPILLFLPGGYYDFDIKRDADNSWTTLYTQRCDDPVEIPTDQIKILENDVAVAYMYDFFMASRDGGLTWSVFDLQKEEPDGSFSIQTVQTRGQPWIMKVRKYGNNPAILIYHSSDFGKTWKNVALRQ